jgi:membrane-bound inhibitor of C-type lysozyme
VGITGDNEIDTASGNLTIDSAGGTVTVDDNLIVSGNLTVNGASTTVNTTNTFIEDTLLALNNGVSASANTYDAGILINRGTGTDSSTINVAMIWDESANQFAMIETTEDGTTAGDINITRYANLQVDRLTGTATQAQYADLAEMYSADADYEPGTVMIFGGDKEITQSTITHDSRTAGVVSTDPAHLMNATLENGTAIALQGRVPCKVKGIVRKGDLITTSNIPGVGTKMNKDLYEIGCVIGKALEDHNSAEQGVIEVVVGRV